ncbi:TonB-dependent receptor [Segetibacter sp. 3557_3]|uniref:TonB-dependent receptor n=1 Tax=Segetibacter sp. 3557_3 TaxID=2547429 RepID=UPI001059132C|nr:TonB-dependent receptor [Segetibacter sp. 3557_3]TDH26970.1 TonB-dependent receptor [Segetibacter sp. 3557_3]
MRTIHKQEKANDKLRTFKFRAIKGATCIHYSLGAAIKVAIILCLLSTKSYAQYMMPVQQVRGIVVDQVLQTPLAGATVLLVKQNKTVATDSKGAFRFLDVPVGTIQLQVSSIGYRQALVDNITVNAGKETVLTVSMETDFKVNDTVFVKANNKRNKPLNDMSAVSARAFTVEETQKYAAAVNDPSRMAMGFPGVVATDDGNNNIAIRGNSPTGLLWRMEGVDIPNPNHFGSTGSSGGGISILSTQLLANSDFVTGAFASEYGNALGGVFDLKLRKGNTEKKEYALQAGVLGLNAAAEGPIMPSYKGSYLVNYRYSTLGLLNKIGVPVVGATNFQDLSFNVYLPTNRFGTFTLFGFGGLSSQDDSPEFDSTKWKDRSDRFTGKFVSNTGVAGLTHTILLGRKTSLRSALAYSYNIIKDNYRYINDDLSLRDDYIDQFKTAKQTLTTTLNHKFSNRSTLRAGTIVNRIQFNYHQRSKENESAPLEEKINTNGSTHTVQGFAQWQYKAMQNLTFNAGLHYLQLLYNNANSLEKRASVKWQADRKNSLAFGYGEHSQIQPLGVYFAQLENANGTVTLPNKDLGLTRARHYVLSWQHFFQPKLAFKAEAYYQQLYNVPVSVYDTATLSTLNIASEYVTDPLTNKGTGRNYGVELSLERYLDDHFYYTASTSLYESKYKALDGIERNTRFNGNYVMNLVAGKEFVTPDGRRTFGINIKTIYAGGLRTTPIDLARSQTAGYAVYRQKEAYTMQNPAYFRTDLRVSLKWNRRHMTSTLSLDIQNATNRQNIFGQFFDSYKGTINTSYQTGLIPVLNYKVEF